MGIKKIGVIKEKQYRVRCHCGDVAQGDVLSVDLGLEGHNTPRNWNVCLSCDGNQLQKADYSVALMNKNDAGEKIYVRVNNRMYSVSFDKLGNNFFVQGRAYSVQSSSGNLASVVGRGAVRGQQPSNNFIESPLAGRIVRVAVSVGDIVHRGQLLVAIESMKMENEICSSIDGVIKTLFIASGNLVQPNQLLVEIDVKGGLCGESEKTNDEAPIQNW